MELELILKYFAGNATPEEALTIEEWAAEAEPNNQLLSELHQSWVTSGANSYAIPEVETAWNQFQNNVVTTKPELPKINPIKFWLQTAAALVVICIISVAGYYAFNTQNQNTPKLIAESTNKPLNVLLKDGSKVLLATNSQLVYPKSFSDSSRMVTLVGDGKFDIVEDKQRPFCIDLGKVNVIVLGTSFEINRNKETITVMVSKGKVAFHNQKDTLVITAGNTGKYIKHKEKFELEQPQVPVTGSFEFNNMNLSAVVQTLSTYFHVNITFANNNLNNCKFNGNYSDLTLVQILDGIVSTFNLTYTIDQKNIKIDGESCQ